MTREDTKSAERMTRDELADVLRGADFRGLGENFGDACERLADAVRALPVIPVCGECRWCTGQLRVWCRRDSQRRSMNPGDAPPSWCPLRGQR